MSTLKVAAVQFEPVWQNPAVNRQHIAEMLQGKEADLIVLPEMFSTGFTMDAENNAEETEGPTLQWMRNLASKKEAAICGSIIVKEGTHYFNRLLWVEPSGKYLTYDKRHLFGMAGEHKVYSAGNEKLLVEYRGWKICPLICYDLRFPVWSRNTEAYDLLLYVAHWPSKRISHWDALLTARAIENQCYTVGVNVVGEDFNQLVYSGSTTFIDLRGQNLAHLVDQEGVIECQLELSTLQKDREALPFLRDRDDFNVKNRT